MGTKPDTWMPFYIGDYLADTLHLSRDQHGGYMLLIIAYWRNGAPLLDDDGYLGAITKASAAEWKKLRPVLSRFFTVTDGHWSHKRIDKEIAKAANRSNERSNAGAKGAAKRWQKDSLAIAEPLANAQQNDAQSPLDVSSLRSETNARGARSAAKAEFEAWWKEYPHKVAKGGAETKYLAARKLVSAETLIEGVKRYVANKPPHIDWCGPAVWLHNRRWEDEPAFVKREDEAPAATGTDRIAEFWKGFEDPDRVKREPQWAIRLCDWASGGFWMSQFGRRPDDPNCSAPPQMRAWAIKKAQSDFGEAA